MQLISPPVGARLGMALMNVHGAYGGRVKCTVLLQGSINAYFLGRYGYGYVQGATPE